MTQVDLLKYLHDPSLLDEGVLIDLKELIDQYPFSATLRMLYLKGLQNRKDIDFDRELKRTAIHLPDRRVLFNYLKEQEVENLVEEEEVNKENEIPIRDDSLEDKEEKQEVKTKAEEKTGDLLDAEIQSEVLANQYVLKVSEELPSLDELRPMARKKKKKQKKEKESTSIVENRELDFFSFIQGKSDQGSSEDEEKARLSEFIAKKEKALKGERAIFSAEKLAERSLIDNEDIITETLAEIFVKQKKYDKAIKAYKRLGLKYPKKSLYFAAQLKKVKKLKSKNKK